MAAPTLEYNNFGDTLKKLLTEHMPKGDDKITFRVLQHPNAEDAQSADGHRFVLHTLPSFIMLKQVEDIVDPDSQSTILLARVKGNRIRDGHLVPNIVPTMFRGDEEGIIQVGRDQPELLARLLFSDENADSLNPSKRRPEAGYVYGIVRPDKEASKKLTRKLAVARATKDVDDLLDDDLGDISGKLSLPTMKGSRRLSFDELRLQLTELAEADPERLSSVLEAQERKLQQLVADGLSLGVLDFNTDAQEWRFKATQQAIAPAVHGIKPEEGLVAYIQNSPNGPDFSKLLLRQVEAARKAAKGGKKGGGGGQ